MNSTLLSGSVFVHCIVYSQRLPSGRVYRSGTRGGQFAPTLGDSGASHDLRDQEGESGSTEKKNSTELQLINMIMI